MLSPEAAAQAYMQTGEYFYRCVLTYSHVMFRRPEAHALTDGLGSAGSWQGGNTYTEALTIYMRARERGFLRVIRLPEDTVADWGDLHESEDL